MVSLGKWWVRFAALSAAGVLLAQEPQQPVDIAQRVLDGGWFEELVFRRGDDGHLLGHYIADVGGAVAMDEHGWRMRPLLGEQNSLAWVRTGISGMAMLFVHGRDDLLAMTDAEFHLGSLSLSTANVELRLSLSLPWRETDGALHRAELFDRLLAIDLLERRRHSQATPELRTLAAKADEPALRRRAAEALYRLTGEGEAPLRRRLDPEAVLLPQVIDASIVVDHARLPDLGWVAGALRRRRALQLATAVAEVGRGTRMSTAMTNGCQTTCDSLAELPFGAALQYGNARHDQSLFVVTASDMSQQFGLTWQAAGEYEHERWQQAALPANADQLNVFKRGSIEVQADHLEARFAVRGAGRPQPGLARDLLQETDAAIRCVVPEQSRLWLALVAAGLPVARVGELRVTFGESIVVELRVDARDEDAADAWQVAITGQLGKLRALVPEQVVERADVVAALAAAEQPVFARDEARLTATWRVPGCTPAMWTALVEALR